MAMYLLLLIAVVFNIIFNTTVPLTFGLTDGLATLSIAPLVVYFFLNCFFFKKVRLDKDALWIILLAILIFGFKLAIGQNYLINVIFLLIIPMIISMCFNVLTEKELTLVRNLLILFFLANCGLSIVERIFQQSLLWNPAAGDTEYWRDQGFFRSSSLLGHPLANAQITAVFMTFVTVSNFKKKYIQIFLFFLGYVSLFCFNVRGATIVVTAIAVPYLLWKINKTTPKNKRWIIKLGVFCIVCGMIYMVTQTSLGGRLMNMDLLDDSAQSRLEVFDFYNYYQTQDEFLWGDPGLYRYMMRKLGTGGVENGVISMILDYGIIFTIPMLLLLFRFQYRKLSVYSKLEKWILLAVFYMIATMNPNLAASVQWTLWIYAYYVFRPELKKVNISNHHQPPNNE